MQEGSEQQDSRLRVALLRDRDSVEALLDWLERRRWNDLDVLALIDEYVVRWRE
jgi:hypothetical protein